MRHLKATLLSGVSAFALAAANPDAVLAADISPVIVTKAPPTILRDNWTWWVEGGAVRLEGDPGVAGMTNFDVDPKRRGWEGAIGFDYRSAATGWIWSGQFRYGQNGSNSASNSPVATFLIGPLTPVTPVNVVGSNSANRKEHHWAADFMVGRDLGIGLGQQVGKFGIRVAEIMGKTTGSAQWGRFPASAAITACTPGVNAFYCASEQRSYSQTNRFLGIGPRFELSGRIPMGDRWSFEYMGAAAGLYGQRKAEQTIGISRVAPTSATIPPPICVAGCPVDANSKSNNFVFNADAMVGISYAFSPNARLLINYRFDGYWSALRGFDANGNVTNLDRFYHGPMARLTVTY